MSCTYVSWRGTIHIHVRPGGGLTRCRKKRVSLHRSREKLWKLFVFTGCIFLCLYRFRNIPRNNTHISECETHNSERAKRTVFNHRTGDGSGRGVNQLAHVPREHQFFRSTCATRDTLRQITIGYRGQSSCRGVHFQPRSKKNICIECS